MVSVSFRERTVCGSGAIVTIDDRLPFPGSVSLFACVGLIAASLLRLFVGIECFNSLAFFVFLIVVSLWILKILE